jgi:hypothetical protein
MSVNITSKMELINYIIYIVIIICMHRILVWEDGFCNFAASAAAPEINSGGSDCPNSSSVYGNCELIQPYQGLQPELFFKMSHEIYNYGEGYVIVM